LKRLSETLLEGADGFAECDVKKKARFAADACMVEAWVVPGLGNGGGSAGAAAAEAGDVDDVCASWRNRLLGQQATDAAPAAASGVSATLARLGPHLRVEKKFCKAAAIFAKLLRKVGVLSPSNDPALQRARLDDALLLRDGLALALNGARADFVHKAGLRGALVDLFDAALSRVDCFPARAAAEVALWALAASAYNTLAETSAEHKITQHNVAAVLERCLGAFEALAGAATSPGYKRSVAEIREAKAKLNGTPAVLVPNAGLCGARGYDVLSALAEAFREVWAPKDGILRCFELALSCTEAASINPLQRRKLETLSSTLRATRVRGGNESLWAKDT